MAYEVELTRGANRQLERLLKGASEARRQNLRRAFSIVRSNPYPTNPDVSAGAIKRLRGSRKWRLKVDYHYRMIYRIEGRRVIVE